jgi:Uma2 family endonuclease
MSHQPKTTCLTPEEYLSIERKAEYKRDYFDGEIYAMTGASREHNLITGNVYGELRQQLKGKPCEAYASDMRVRVPAARLYTYPDVVVVCGEPKFEDAHVDTLLNPTLIVEVLSRSTETYDRGKRSVYYRMIDSLAEYLLVEQDEYRIEQYVKQADGRWLLSEETSLEGSIDLASVECRLALSEAYDRVDLSHSDS